MNIFHPLPLATNIILASLALGFYSLSLCSFCNLLEGLIWAGVTCLKRVDCLFSLVSFIFLLPIMDPRKLLETIESQDPFDELVPRGESRHRLYPSSIGYSN